MAFFVKTISVAGRGARMKRPDGAAGRLELAGGLLGDGVDAPVHVGMGGLVVVVHRVEHRPGALGRRRRVEVDEAFAVRLLLEQGEFLAEGRRRRAGLGLDGGGHERSAS